MILDSHPLRTDMLDLLLRGQQVSTVDAGNNLRNRKERYEKMNLRFSALIAEALNSLTLKDIDRRAVRLIAGLDKLRPVPSLMSHLPLRRHAGQALHEHLAPLFAEDTSRSWFFGTFITDLGNSLEYTPVLERGRLHRDVRKMLDLVGMHAIGVTELQLARFPFGSAGRTISAHVHTIGYVDDPAVTARELKGEIAARNTLSNWLGAPVAVFRPIITDDELAARCAYLFKPPLNESWLITDRQKRSGFVTQSHGNVNRWGALRLTELLSHLTLRDAVLARGDLVLPKGDWIRDVNSWVPRRAAREQPDIAALFKRVWAQASLRRQRTPPSIRHDASSGLDDAWVNAMAGMMAEVAANQARFDAYQASRRR